MKVKTWRLERLELSAIYTGVGYAPAVIECWVGEALAPTKEELEAMVRPIYRKYYRVIPYRYEEIEDDR